jgi:hypothetical protein
LNGDTVLKRNPIKKLAITGIEELCCGIIIRYWGSITEVTFLLQFQINQNHAIKHHAVRLMDRA